MSSRRDFCALKTCLEQAKMNGSTAKPEKFPVIIQKTQPESSLEQVDQLIFIEAQAHSRTSSDINFPNPL